MRRLTEANKQAEIGADNEKKMKDTLIKIIQNPTDVKFKCPYCKHENHMYFKEFILSQLSEEEQDWDRVKCSECGEEIEVRKIEWW